MATPEKETKGVIPWRPITETTRWQQEIDRMFADFFGRSLRPFLDEHRRTPFSFGTSAPAVDLYVDGDELVAKAELPGMEKDEIRVNVRNHQLTIQGEKKREEKVKEEDYYLSERPFGPFLRTFDLPGEVPVKKVRSSFKNGVLEIRLPKTETIKKKTIKVQVE